MIVEGVPSDLEDLVKCKKPLEELDFQRCRGSLYETFKLNGGKISERTITRIPELTHENNRYEQEILLSMIGMRSSRTPNNIILNACVSEVKIVKVGGMGTKLVPLRPRMAQKRSPLTSD
ncbi:hypothetical protein QJS10_CPB13g01241 [Acorus calamus]|uniref:Uncharacterized protein n=1 Tax=Acorus calamus TaxID=4465 RepID=A0AAV9DJA0_ACOCL|nr:hypothetical protein QJS10_CPB13g01241 [Acorus calamus]